MPYEVQRDVVGHGASPPDPHGLGGAKLAMNCVMNHGEGAEPSIQCEQGDTACHRAATHPHPCHGPDGA